jgi:hypothetical protein
MRPSHDRDGSVRGANRLRPWLSSKRFFELCTSCRPAAPSEHPGATATDAPRARLASAWSSRRDS